MSKAKNPKPNELDIDGQIVKQRVQKLEHMKENVEGERTSIQTYLQPVWAALKKKQTVNGCKGTKEWAEEFLGKTTRYCQMILKDGSRKRTPEQKAAENANRRVRIIKLGETVRFEGIDGTFKISEGDGAITFEKSRKYNDAVRLAVTKVDDDEKPTPKKKTKRYSTKVPSGDFITMPRAPHKTHKMQPDGKRTWCGKTLGDTLAVDAKMDDAPTCKQCQNGEFMDKARNEMSEPTQSQIVRIAHIVGGVTAGGGQNSRMRSYGLCGRNFTPRSDQGTTIPKSGRIHEAVLPGEKPTCPECLALQAQSELSAPVKVHAYKNGSGGNRSACGLENSSKSGLLFSPEPTCPECIAESEPLSAPAKALAATVDGVAPEILDVVKRQKSRIALGLHPTNSGCPDAEEPMTAPARVQVTHADLDNPFQRCGNLDGDDEDAL
jgi:hypothetical protein